ncbi:MAG: PBP1A family penicillin-binding protein [Candidatus Sumerlaeia bacterium]|nr:PBP1A family penicillin-binding protein [Candidatus Sumerlaeia bacterium]
MAAKKRKPRSAFQRWFRLFAAMLILTVVCSSAAISGLLVYLGTLPPIEQLENYAPPQVTRVLDRTGRTEITTFKRENRVIVPLSDIPEILVKAFLAAEDEHFYKHFGIDFVAIGRALWTNLKRGRFSQGFSTITLQLPRNIQLTSRERNIMRKLRDIVLALQIEKRYSKDQILEFYLNQVYLGSGAFGVKAAAKTYFNKDDLHDLTLSECALLAGLPRAPSIDSPLRNPDRALRRRNLVLGRMRDAGCIDDEVYEKTRNEPLHIHPPPVERNRAPYFVEYLKTWLAQQDPELSFDALQSNGYIIYSTLDSSITAICEEELRTGLREAEEKWQQRKIIRLSEDENANAPLRPGDIRLAEIRSVTTDSITVRAAGYTASIPLPARLPYYQPEKILKQGNLIDVRVTSVNRPAGRFEGELFDKAPIQGGVVVLDVKSGEILALCGGYDFYDAETNGQWNRAVQAERQAGSCFKPFVYAIAMESGFTPASVFVDEPVRFANGYTPKNYERQYFGPTTLQVALEHSRNVVTILLYQRLMGQLGARQMRDRLDAFNVVGSPAWKIPVADVTVALGSLGVTPLAMAAAYIPFANHGVALQPVCVQKITEVARTAEKEERLVKRFRPAEKVVMSEVGAYQMAHMLRAAVLRGTGRPITRYFEDVRGREPNRPIPQMAGKTGTTNNCTDAWFAGFTPQLVVVVYMGFDQPRSLGPEMTGSYVCIPTWCRIVDRILKTGDNWQIAFAEPPGIEYADVDATTGRILAKGEWTGGESVLRQVPFRRGSIPTGSE